MQALIKQLEEVLARVRRAMEQLDIPGDETRLEELTARTRAPGFWDDPQAAADVSRQVSELSEHVDEWRGLERRTADALELARMGDESMRGGLEADLEQIERHYAEKEFQLKLSGPHDKSSAVLQLYAGTGGTDAQDWTQMLLRMYLRWAERQGFAATVLEQSPGEEAGLKSATVEIKGPYAYGKLKGEKGVHRLVRLSPFNADNLRQTSFAMVEVIPELEQDGELSIDPKDLRIDVYRSGGHGGQSVNTTDSAVRITHLPTGIVVAIQNERSQLQNREKAMAILRSRLTALMEEQHKATLSELRGERKEAAWGNQIRSYVLHPYTKVKDHRTGHETAQAAEVLDGELDEFIEQYLQSRIGA